MLHNLHMMKYVKKWEDEAKFRAECKKWRDGEQSAVATMKKLDMKRNRFYKIVKALGI